MDEYEVQHIKCPKCTKKFDLEVILAIDIDCNNKYKEKHELYDIFIAKCPYCGEAFFLNHKLLIMSRLKKYIINYCEKNKDAVVATKLFNENLEFKNYKKRLVMTVEDMFEKIQCFENNVDDKVIECMKEIRLKNANLQSLKACGRAQIKAIEMIEIDEKGNISFAMIRNLNEDFYFGVDKELYDSEVKYFEDIIKNDDVKNYLIDSMWARTKDIKTTFH